MKDSFDIRKPLAYVQHMNANTIKEVRSLNAHVGRLSAIKVLRSCGLPFSVAKLAVDDIITNKPWTKPEIKAYLNNWEQGYAVSM